MTDFGLYSGIACVYVSYVKPMPRYYPKKKFIFEMVSQHIIMNAQSRNQLAFFQQKHIFLVAATSIPLIPIF